MKIAKIEDLHAAGGIRRSYSFLKITTDEGLVGWSEFNEETRLEAPGLAAFPGLTMVIRKVAETLIGRDPRDVASISQLLYAGSRLADGGIAQHASAAIEHALLDIKAKSLGVPVHELFGGAIRDRVPVYWSHCGSYRAWYADALGVPPVRTLDDIADLGREVATRGFRALKTNQMLWDGGQLAQHPKAARFGDWEGELNAWTLRSLIEQLTAFREGAGPETGLLLDVGFTFKPDSLRRLARALEPLGMFWLEVDLYDSAALAAIRWETATPIASLEAVFGARNLRPYLDRQAVDTAIIDVQYNGLFEAVRMANLAYAHEVKIAAHQAYGPLSILHGATLCALAPNFKIMEYDVDRPSWVDELVTHPAVIEGGEFVMPARAGWGTDVDEEGVLAHPPTDVGAASWLLDYHRAHG